MNTLIGKRIPNDWVTQGSQCIIGVLAENISGAEQNFKQLPEKNGTAARKKLFN